MNGRTNAAAEEKQSLRAKLHQRLASLSPEVAGEAAARVADRVLETPEVTQASGILTCLSFGTEIDTWNLVRRLGALGRAVYVPRADPKDGRLHVHPFPCELRALSFGLRQPPRGAPEVVGDEIAQLVDVALVLGLGFDRLGYRLGHGNGYFDRFLADRRIPAIGLAFGLQLLDELPVEPHDVPMTAVVTECGTWPEGRC